VCQLDALQSCLNLPALRKALSTLPKSLDETYARILCNIPEDQSDHALRILQWLTHSLRPLTLKELAETIVINVTGDPSFDEEARYPIPRDILTLCPGLITMDEAVHGKQDLLFSTVADEDSDTYSVYDSDSTQESDNIVVRLPPTQHYSGQSMCDR
jgi:hypothetical protein